MRSNISLALTYILAAYITRICIRSPNPVPKTRHPNDRILSLPAIGAGLPQIGGLIFLLSTFLHILLLATSTTPESSPSLLCPNPSHVNPIYLTWSSHTKFFLGLLFTCCVLRIQAYQTLGKDFTFELAKPTKLVKTGIYAWVQHPSYLPLIVLLTINMALFVQPDGALGCFLPLKLIEFGSHFKWVNLAAYLAFSGLLFSARVKDEEEMLRQTFGKEWEEWHARTARFIPGVL